MRPVQRATTLYRYDALDRLVETEDALGGISKKRYDAEGRMMESLDARSVKTTLEYIPLPLVELLHLFHAQVRHLTP
jgi:YD repeat-containing protein